MAGQIMQATEHSSYFSHHNYRRANRPFHHKTAKQTTKVITVVGINHLTILSIYLAVICRYRGVATMKAAVGRKRNETF